MPCETWLEETKTYYEELNRVWNFFETPDLRQFNDRVTQFVPLPRPNRPDKSSKIGRNDPCHCGSGKKYKKCHG